MMHRPARKRFPRNPYTVTYVMYVLECDMTDLQAYARYNDNYRYILTVIDVFSKYLHMVPVKTKSGPSIASAFRSILADPNRRPVWVRTDKGKEFLNKHFQDMLREEGIQFQTCRNPDVKCAAVERLHRTIRDRL
jgi:transposase InsO family protein